LFDRDMKIGLSRKGRGLGKTGKSLSVSVGRRLIASRRHEARNTKEAKDMAGKCKRLRR